MTNQNNSQDDKHLVYPTKFQYAHINKKSPSCPIDKTMLAYATDLIEDISWYECPTCTRFYSSDPQNHQEQAQHYMIRMQRELEDLKKKQGQLEEIINSGKEQGLLSSTNK
ncbi:MAG: hypothetical protein AABX52_01540 [Nanoarchaeota archaeon]